MPKNDTAAGHRKRLRAKFIKSDLKGFDDYEIIEFFLILGTPRKDCKLRNHERKYRIELRDLELG